MSFKLLPQLKRVFRGRPKKCTINPKQDILNDVYDGDIYSNFFEKESEGIRLGSVMSYTMNTDGISLCEKSKLTLTPVILSVNELPLAERFCIDNVVICGKFKKSISTILSYIRVKRFYF